MAIRAFQSGASSDVYTQITAVGDIAHPSWRGGALGVYRLWHDSGYAIGPLALGLIALVGVLTAAFWAAAILLGMSSLILLLMLEETDPDRRTKPPAWERWSEQEGGSFGAGG